MKLSRQDGLPLAIVAAVLLCLAVGYLYLHNRRPDVQTVTFGTPASPGADQSPGLQPLAPHVYDSTGELTLQVGDVADSNGVEFGVTKLAAPYSASDPALQASRGELLVVDVELRNTQAAGGQPLTISSAADFELTDGTGQSYQPVAIPGVAKPPDGAIAPGAMLDGSLGYDVPTGQTFVLRFKNELLMNGQIAVDLGKH